MTIERIIELLEIEKECILKNATGECNRYCAKCDLVQDDTELHEMYTEAIAILKELAPRLMTPEEAFHIAPGKSCIVESNSPLGEITIIQHGLFMNLWPNGVCEFEFPYCKGELPTVEYGKTWRCWTSEPTDEQRKATGWTHAAD